MFNALKKYKRRKAFTLIELVVVMAVIAILAGVSVGAYFGITNNANESATEQFAKQAQDLFTIKSVSDNKKYSSLDDMAADFISNDLDENGLDKIQVNYVMLDKGEGEAQDVLFVFNSSKWVCSVYDGSSFGEFSDYYSSFEDMANDFASMAILADYDLTAFESVENKENILSFQNAVTSGGKYSYLRKASRVQATFLGDTYYPVPNGQSLYQYFSRFPEFAGVVESANGLIDPEYLDRQGNPIDKNARLFSSFIPDDSDNSTMIDPKTGEEFFANYNESSYIGSLSTPAEAASLNLADGEYQFMIENVKTAASLIPHTYYAKNGEELVEVLGVYSNDKTHHQIYVGNNATLNQDLELSNGSSLNLGWDVGNLSNGFEIVDSGETDSNKASNPSKLTIGENAKLTLRDSSLNVSSRIISVDSAATTLKFDDDENAAGQLIVDGQLHLFNSSFDGSGKVTTTDDLVGENSAELDDPRIFVDKTSSITLLLNIYNFPGGTIASMLSRKGVFPFSKYGIFGANVPFEMEAGGQFIGSAYIYAGGVSVNIKITLIGGPDSDEIPVLNVASGKTNVYWEKSDITDETHNRLVFKFTGNIEDGQFSKNYLLIKVDHTMPFPFYNMGIIIQGSARFDDIQMKVLPGSYVKILENTSIDLQTKALFYSEFDYATWSLESGRFVIPTDTPAAYLELPASGKYDITVGYDYGCGFGGLIKGSDSNKTQSIIDVLTRYGESGSPASGFTEFVDKKLISCSYTSAFTVPAKWEPLAA